MSYQMGQKAGCSSNNQQFYVLLCIKSFVSVHPYWWKRQVSHQMWPLGSLHASKKECRREIHLRIWNPWGRTHEVQNRSNQWLHKLGLGPTNNLKKEKKKKKLCQFELIESIWQKWTELRETSIVSCDCIDCWFCLKLISGVLMGQRGRQGRTPPLGRMPFIITLFEIW